eukprot:229099-Chlamydomonas_euryale.AAC.8
MVQGQRDSHKRGKWMECTPAGRKEWPRPNVRSNQQLCAAAWQQAAEHRQAHVQHRGGWEGEKLHLHCHT